MLLERSLLLQRGLFAADLVLIALAWVLAWTVRFEVLTPPEWVSLGAYLGFLPFVLVVWGGVFLLSGLYQTRRAQRLPLMVFAVARAVALGVAASVAALFFFREFSFSRLHMLLFGAISSALLVALRTAIYAALRQARERGHNVRRVLIVGAGKAGQRLARAFQHYPWMGFEVVGFLDDRGDAVDAEPADPFYPGQEAAPRVIGPVRDIGAVLDRLGGVDMVYAALPLSAADKIEAVAEACTTRTAHLCLVPDILGLDLLLNSRVSDVDGLPVIHLLDEAPFDVRQIVKRAADVAFSLAALVLTSPLLALIAAAVKLSSPGPVLYRQTRMGLNGQTFEILKFRSMPVGVEAQSGAVWSRRGEARATPVGAFLRRTSLDELPQFLNVLRGDMSVVGPRPERPALIEGFRHQIPGYMLRHKMNAGITGWAQVHGWRGDTSLEKRIEFDLFYIRNWSLGMDVKILFLTLFRGFVHENAH
ncbi:undecaprenyl-phosphate glucose phosphotransferase [Rubrivirga litoralis]|uniref:Undecaprenyl-phosphate glucose phosphotransferase n=1 Tax=Rubrivirga litoralis TaxID=3075598 RepID=A0ABU3BM44_9BACT|nr:undecaprenyl-phosphate glucose phosphotransferase [Rubrivirga sp. F394]MDT0630360.1 undecaprenyl-phosphate glucose phosphotransferase [Rubrivirga sp. F394]